MWSYIDELLIRLADAVRSLVRMDTLIIFGIQGCGCVYTAFPIGLIEVLCSLVYGVLLDYGRNIKELSMY